MNWLATQTTIQAMAQVSVERMLNALPEGLLIAFVCLGIAARVAKTKFGNPFCGVVSGIADGCCASFAGRIVGAKEGRCRLPGC